MTLYRVEFANEWITGRWGFTDRVLTELGARVTEPSRLENAWLLRFNGTASDLGDRLSQELNIQRADFRRFGTIFQITILSEPHGPEPRRSRARLLEPSPPPWERQPHGRRKS
ncbi:MAG TPA: hypothetical protein VKB51_13220 [bacterium]|nr:hypothetical protein [bacterium]